MHIGLRPRLCTVGAAIATAVLSTTAPGGAQAQLSPLPNLAWTGPKIYAPAPTVSEFISGLGINSVVDQLAPATPFTVTRRVAETTRRRGVPGPYSITETVIRWIFQANPTAGLVRWVPGRGAPYVVFQQTAAGPPLRPGQSQPVTFGPMGPFPCGLYQEILRIDPAGMVRETTKADNAASHFFFIPGGNDFRIAVNVIQDPIRHNQGRINTDNFVVTPLVGPPPIYAGFSYATNEGSTADTVPAPPLVMPPPPNIQMFVAPKTHSHPNGSITGKVTLISQDGCIVHQKSATVEVIHTGIFGERMREKRTGEFLDAARTPPHHD